MTWILILILGGQAIGIIDGYASKEKCEAAGKAYISYETVRAEVCIPGPTTVTQPNKHLDAD